jgi:hypothetical protein
MKLRGAGQSFSRRFSTQLVKHSAKNEAGSAFHHVVERVMGRDPFFEGKETPQKVELLPNPSLDLAEVLGLGHRPARTIGRISGSG